MPEGGVTVYNPNAMISLLVALCAQNEAAPVFTRFDFERERVKNKVTATAVLQNPLSEDLLQLRITVTYFDHDRELRRSVTETVARLDSGRSVTLALVGEHVEKFDRYEVAVVHGDWTYNYVGEDVLKTPVLKRGPPPKLEIASPRDVRPERFPGNATVSFVLRNIGGGKARETTARIAFLDPRGGVVRRVYARLGNVMDVETEETWEVVVPDCPEYARVEVVPTCLLFEVPGQADPFTNAREPEVGRTRLVRLRDGSARLTGTLRNGSSSPVKDVVVTFDLAGGRHPVTITGPVGAGEQRPFELYLPDCPPTDGSHSHGLSYGEAADSARPALDPAPRARKTATRRTR
jgi:hypothetical protein